MGVTKLSQLEIDADKDWAAKKIENLGAPDTGDDAPRRDTIDSKINTHKGDPSAHHAKTTDASELTSGILDAARLPSNQKVATIIFIIDGGASAITTGEKGHLEIPFACTIQQVTMLADQSGSIVVDIWKLGSEIAGQHPEWLDYEHSKRRCAEL